MKWLTEAHLRAELTRAREENLPPPDESDLRREFQELLQHYGCSAKSIARRGHELDDFLNERWSNHKVYHLDSTSTGASIDRRMEVYREASNRAFDEWYSESRIEPAELIHVTCTGYRSPSPAQVAASSRKWKNTNVTHLYHMGCYAAIPALRVGVGFAGRGAARVDIAHTELCTLLLNPSLHSPEQLIVQSLFADGMIRYELTQNSEPAGNERALEIKQVQERLIPGTEDSMTWNLRPWGMQMSLSKNVPFQIARPLKGFLTDLFAKEGLTYNAEKPAALFAIHPGGPRILDQLANFLRLAPEQLHHSRKVLYERGNMSSATLPHIWAEILQDPSVEASRYVVSLAFGPGLTIAGALMKTGR